MNSNLLTTYSKTCPDYFLPAEGVTSNESCVKWTVSGILEHGECLTLNGSEWPSAEEGSSACSLASILEPNAAPKYYLSPRACAGILRRAARRGRSLPTALKASLENVARAPS